MGTNIDLYVEYRSPITKGWEPFGYGYYMPRNYQLFARMAGVRDELHEVLYHPKGIPESLSEFFLSKYEDSQKHAECCHHSSWLNNKDFSICMNTCKPDNQKDILEYQALLAAMNVLEENGCDTRVVFWFIL